MTVELAHDEVRAWLTLLRAPALGAAGIRELLGRHGNAGASLSAARRDDRVPESARRWIAAPDGAVLDADLDWLAAPSHHLITCASGDYPALLRDIPNAPAALFVVGDPACLWSPQIAIVGA